jgi:predicted NAD/FAD-binding protein
MKKNCLSRPLQHVVDGGPLVVSQLLNEYSPHEVHLYEADDRPGGHANTVHVSTRQRARRRRHVC